MFRRPCIFADQIISLIELPVLQLNDLKIARSELQELLPSQNAEDIEEYFSHLAWSVICEPGDGFAGLLVSALGATAALNSELQNLSSQSLKVSLLESGISASELDRFGVFEVAHHAARERWRPRLSLGAVKQAISKMQQIKGFMLTPVSAGWPEQLSDLGYNAPLALWVRGSQASLDRLSKSVAVVGSRGATTYGEFATEAVVAALVEKGLSVISGGAYGIDAIAHKSTLALQGNTVAVMAGGIDKLYPSGNSQLLKRVTETGAVVSEMPPGSIPTKWRFLQRNRLIAALSQSTIVVEANWRSGALNTATHAQTLDREIYAVPGPISSPKSAGTNKLIADGRAQLIVDPADLLERMGIQAKVPTQLELSGLGAIEVRVLDAIGFDSLEIAEICSAAGLTRDEARFGLGNLELEGLVARRGNAWAKTQTTL
jgi:DNA processing protein